LQLAAIRPLHMSAYIEGMGLSAPSVKQHLAALRGLFNWLVIRQVVPDNPAMFVKGPRFSRQIGVTPILEAEQMRAISRSGTKLAIGCPIRCSPPGTIISTAALFATSMRPRSSSVTMAAGLVSTRARSRA
jgi:hypothetical protein